MSIFSLKLEACAGTKPPTYYFQELADIANRLQLDVSCDMNGIKVYVQPGCDVERLKVVYADCCENKIPYCCDMQRTRAEIEADRKKP